MAGVVKERLCHTWPFFAFFLCFRFNNLKLLFISRINFNFLMMLIYFRFLSYLIHELIFMNYASSGYICITVHHADDCANKMAYISLHVLTANFKIRFQDIVIFFASNEMNPHKTCESIPID